MVAAALGLLAATGATAAPDAPQPPASTGASPRPATPPSAAPPPPGGGPKPPTSAAAASRGRRPPSYSSDVAPLLARWCSDCHAGPDAEANLRLDRYEFLLVGGDSGPPVVIGDPAASLLVAKVERRDRPAMPPRKRLPRAAVTTLRAWIAAGAPP